jgi:hypothetical protein
MRRGLAGLQRLKPFSCSVLVAELKPGPPKAVRGNPMCASGQTFSKRRATCPKHTVSLHNIFLRALMLALLVVSLAASASARDLKIEKFSSEVIVEPDASLSVTETIQANFTGEWHGLYRLLRVEYETAQGFNYTLFVKLVDATDDAGQPLKVESSRDGQYLKWKIYINDATDADRTIHLHYKVRNGVRFLEDHDELYWDATGEGWDVPLSGVSAQILLPQGATGVRTDEYTGSFGSRGKDAELTTSGSTVEAFVPQPLGLHEGLTVVVAWDKGAVKEPGTSDLIGQFLESNWPVFFPIPVFLFMFWLWYTRGRDPRMGAIAVQYEPPDGMSPAEAGTLVDQSAAMRDITATIVDLAIRGYIVIEEKDKSGVMGLTHNKEYIFHLKKSTKEWASLKPHELVLLAGIFSNGAVADVELSSLQNEFYKTIPSIQESIFDGLMERGYFQHRPDYERSAYVGGGIAMGAVLFFLGNAVAQKMGMVATPFFIGAILSGGIIAGFGFFMSARTVSGVKALSGVLGFEDFLTHVEADHMERVGQTPETFERFLPYAMALGVEKKWVGAFQNIYSQPPSWYQGGYLNGGFYPIMFISSLDNMTMRAGSVMSSAPRSSSGGSGFGGGGYSGGGFGGGGGGGF